METNKLLTLTDASFDSQEKYKSQYGDICKIER